MQAAWLTKNGLDFDTAMALSDFGGDPENAAMGLALAVVFGEFKGGEFDWDALRWKKKDNG